MSHLFVYGTLMIPSIMARAAEMECPAGEPAILEGHKRRLVKDQSWPGIVACEGESVEGIVYRGLSDLTLEILDEFEGEPYERILVQVQAGEDTVDAYVFRMKDSFEHLLSDEPWSLEKFREIAVRQFMESYEGFEEDRP